MKNHNQILEKINQHVFLFKNWLKDHYSENQIEEENYDDTGYPNWDKIEDTFEFVFKEIDFSVLTTKELENISFLLARQWDVGVIFPYFREEISQIGMTEEQLLILANFGINSKEWSFRQQCAASIYKAKNYKVEATSIALKYYKEENAGIRSQALNSLHKLNYFEINKLLLESWKHNDELERIYCLYIWKEIDEKIFKYYIEEAKKDTRKTIRENIEYLLTNKNDNDIEQSSERT